MDLSYAETHIILATLLDRLGYWIKEEQRRKDYATYNPEYIKVATDFVSALRKHIDELNRHLCTFEI